METAMDKKTDHSGPVRIGMLNSLDISPLGMSWREAVPCADWQLVVGSEDEINTKLVEGQIDLGFISSFSYGENTDQYVILPGLSLSTSTAIGQAILFSHIPLERLDDCQVFLCSYSISSAVLSRIVVEEWSKVSPQYTAGNIDSIDDIKKDFSAVLATGVGALRMIEESRYLYQFDLGDIWKRKTGLPFVYNVCVVRRQFAEEDPYRLQRIHRELLRCRDEGLAELDKISEVSAAQSSLTVAGYRAYLQGLEYDLSGEKRAALEKFFEVLIKRKELKKNALPLQFFDCDFDE